MPERVNGRAFYTVDIYYLSQKNKKQKYNITIVTKVEEQVRQNSYRVLKLCGVHVCYQTI